jgi:hypothetical protein
MREIKTSLVSELLQLLHNMKFANSNFSSAAALDHSTFIVTLNQRPSTCIFNS